MCRYFNILLIPKMSFSSISSMSLYGPMYNKICIRQGLYRSIKSCSFSLPVYKYNILQQQRIGIQTFQSSLALDDTVANKVYLDTSFVGVRLSVFDGKRFLQLFNRLVTHSLRGITLSFNHSTISDILL